jgi:hypothetical protein
MIITTLVILTATYFSGKHYRKKALNNLSETGKQEETQFSRRPKLLMGKESFTQKGLKYRAIVLVIIIVGLILAVVGYFIHF